jgi:uncharacterized protein
MAATAKFFRIFVDCSTKRRYVSRLSAAFCYSFGHSLEGRFDMALDAELLEILACPNCKTPVVLVHNGTGLKCNTCHRVYPIKDDIPVMLIDEATIEK